MKIAIYQPSFVPWLGFFKMFYDVDAFVFYDDVQMTIRDWRTRNRIRTPEGWMWLIIPIKYGKISYRNYKIFEVKINNESNWKRKHLNSFKSYYSKAPFFDEIFDFLNMIYSKKHVFLVEFLNDIFFSILDYLGIEYKNKVKFSREMSIPSDLKKTDRLIYIIKNYFPETKVYVTGPRAKNYLNEEKFHDMGVEVEWFEYEHPYYKQILWGSNVFISHLSILDLLFNHGKESKDIILKRKIIRPSAGIEIVSANNIFENSLIKNGGK